MKNGNSHKESRCPVCSSTAVSTFVEILNVPVHCNLLWPTRDEARQIPRGDIRLGFCGSCGHVFNVAFDPAATTYNQDYENSLHFSPRFQEYARSVAEGLIARHDLRHKQIVEIGCGKGEFLHLLCELGENRGLGFDPSYKASPTNGVQNGRISFIQDFYSERYSSYPADFVCCRHVLEHIQSPRDFISNLRRAIGTRTGTVVFFEVPNVIYSLRHSGIWDLIYEHCSYFSVGSLTRLFASCGFKVYKCEEAYKGQFLSIEAAPIADSAHSKNGHWDGMERMACEAAAFAEHYNNKVEGWRRELEKIKTAGQRAVVWGGGSKGVTFLNTLQKQNHIEYVVDINPRKHGKYVAGTGQKIVPPEHLMEYRPDIAFAMNPIYLEEIRQLLKTMNLATKLVPV
jgi:SAM-dependent methyltransferase